MDLNNEPTSDGLPVGETTPQKPPSSEGTESSSEQPATQLSEAEKAAKVHELLSEPQTDSDTGDAPPEETPADPKPLASPTDLAASLGVDAKDVYSMPIPVGDDGETVTLSALKDAYKDKGAVTAEIVEKVAAINERESALIVEQQVWTELAANPNVPPQALEGARNALTERMQAEGRKFLDMVPELKDETKLDIFRSDMVETLGKFGYQPHEVVLTDARQALLIRDYMRQKRQLDKLIKDTRPKPPQSSKPQGRGAQRRSAPKPTHGADAQIAAVSALLKG